MKIKSFKSFNESKSESEIKQLCDQYGILNYTIKDGLVNVDGDVDLSDENLTKLLVKFGQVTGNFNCNENYLTDLKGSPKKVNGYFHCDNNKLTDLTGSPREVGGYFSCYDNELLTSLKGAPELIEGKFHCKNTPVHSIFQSDDPKLISIFNMIFSHNIDLPLIEYWFSIIDKPLTDIRLKEIKKYYEI